jgi:hypothetical protein
MISIDTTQPLGEAENEIFAKVVNDLQQVENLDSRWRLMQRIQDKVIGSYQPKYESWPMFLPASAQS